MKTAMILAAGRGDRLKPLSNYAPKSLCEVAQQPLIVHHIRNLIKADFTRVIINHAWLGGKIRQALGNGDTLGIEILYSAEPPGGLETGGGIAQALPLLGNKAFACINADIFTDFDFAQLDLSLTDADTHLVLVDNPVHNRLGDFGLNDAHMLTTDKPCYTFSGIAVHHPRMFEKCTIGRYSITPILENTIRNGKGGGQYYSGIWIDIGCVQRLEEANAIAANIYEKNA